MSNTLVLPEYIYIHTPDGEIIKKLYVSVAYENIKRVILVPFVGTLKNGCKVDD